MSVKNFFVYGVLFPLLDPTANAVASQIMALDSDADFEVHRLSMFMPNPPGSITTNNTENFPRVTVMLSETVTGRRYMANPVQLSTFFGSGGRPFVLRTPIFLQKSARLKIELTNPAEVYPFSPAPLDVRLSFIGVKIFS